MQDAPFTDAELDYLEAQRLGRLATVSPAGAPQNNPVGFVYNQELGTIDVFGLNLAATRKFRNVAANGQVALVVDDQVSVDPWEVRGVEVRGVAEALDGVRSPRPGMSPQVIRIHPRRIISWNVDPARSGMWGRNVADDLPAA
jgi:pyridoxamine 5'-phosphate oxidase family protein